MIVSNDKLGLFNPRSFSTDWEIMVFDRLNRGINMDKLSGFAGILSNELNMPIHLDWNTVECALGLNTGYDQFAKRVRLVTDSLTQRLAEYDLDPCPLGSHPIEPMFNSSHIHVGTVFDEIQAIYLEYDLIKYTPAFAALAANSPFAQGRRGFKSYRVCFCANGCTHPSTVRDPYTAQNDWGMDAGPKLQVAPTVEVRVVDCASSRNFLTELAVLIAAFVHQKGSSISGNKPSPETYERTMMNRWAAAKYGLQATFLWDNGAKPVVEILEEMMETARPALAILGVGSNGLPMIRTMLRKRTCQADFAASIAERYTDEFQLASVLTKLMRHWNVFDDYLESAPILEPKPVLDAAAVQQELLDFMGENTHFYRTRFIMRLPPVTSEAIIASLVEQGSIIVETDPDRGRFISRIQ